MDDKYYRTPEQIADIEQAMADYIAMLDEMLETGELSAKEIRVIQKREMLQPLPGGKNKTIEDLFYDDSRTYKEANEKNKYFNKQIMITPPHLIKNPRQVCTHGHVSWEIIRRAGGTISYREYMRRGGRHKNTGWGGDLLYDIKKGYVTIEDLTATTLQKEQKEAEAKLILPENNQPPKGVKQPARTEQIITSIDRDPAIITYIKRNANGKCELCKQPAPFKDTYGNPFLEIHHVKHLADDGSDTPDNTVAICPNCHRALHYAHDKDKLKQKLYDTIKRLKPQ